MAARSWTGAMCLAVLVTALSACGAPSTSPSQTITDPRHGHQVPVTCEAIDTGACTTVAGEILRYLSADTAKVEALRIGALEGAPAGVAGAFLVTIDHEMFLSSGEQAYRAIQRSAGDPFEFEVILDR